MRIHGIVDSIEDDIAVILIGDEEKKISIPVKYLPINAIEGDVIDISLNINKGETIKRSQKLKNLMEQIFEEN